MMPFNLQYLLESENQWEMSELKYTSWDALHKNVNVKIMFNENKFDEEFVLEIPSFVNQETRCCVLALQVPPWEFHCTHCAPSATIQPGLAPIEPGAVCCGRHLTLRCHYDLCALALGLLCVQPAFCGWWWNGAPVECRHLFWQWVGVVMGLMGRGWHMSVGIGLLKMLNCPAGSTRANTLQGPSVVTIPKHAAPLNSWMHGWGAVCTLARLKVTYHWERIQSCIHQPHTYTCIHTHWQSPLIHLIYSCLGVGLGFFGVFFFFFFFFFFFGGGVFA